ncbi:MAG: hypothetical protein DRJ42_13170 [Deltaproteobacteria bacterium]|nr:MAG: hypothetical protein DRJ42_13170 [Deltaproteobacteria bacterium]
MPILTEEERVGTLLGGRYQLDSILGRGGTGVVFDATHNWTGRKVAVKLLKPEYSRDLALTRRFLQEARAAAGLSHPNVVQVLDMGNDDEGTVHLVLERLEGKSLGGRLEDQQVLEPEETLAILIPIMDALRLAHDRGIIHRDLKPDNLYLHRDDTGRMTPKLLDFGMSKMVDAAWGHSTQSGTLIGTPFYMSPEQAEGRKEQGPATDVWSMGVILYRCLTGSLPFYASTPTKLLLSIVAAEPTPTAERGRNVPPALAEVTDRCLRADLDERWPSMEALIEALRAAAEEEGVAFPALPDADAAPAPAPESFDPGPPQTDGSRRPKALLVGVAVAVALASGLGLWMSQRTDAISEEDPAATASTPVQEAQEDREDQQPSATAPDGREVLNTPSGSPSEDDQDPDDPPEGPGAPAETDGTDEPPVADAPRHPENHPRGMGSRATMGSSTPPSTMDAPPTGAGTMRLPGVAEDW